MMFFKRPIAISLSPNTQKDDFIIALKTLFSPRRWFRQEEVEKLEKKFAKIFGDQYHAIAVNSGRSGEYLILKGLGIGRGDEVILQAFTCVAVPNSVIWLKAKPVYADIDSSYNLDPKVLNKRITRKTRAIIVQHTFGSPANLNKIKKIAKKHKIPVIEDCAHALGASYQGKKVGTLSEASFFSFGRDKIISSVFGGMILTADKRLYKKLRELQSTLPKPSPFWIIQQLLHPILFHLFILPFYNFGLGKLTLGKAFLITFQTLHLLSKPVCKKEKSCGQPSLFPRKMPGALAILAINQLDKLESFNKKRRAKAKDYFTWLNNYGFQLPSKNKGASWLRFPVRHSEAVKFYDFTKTRRVLLGDWYKGIIVPLSDLSLVGYESGSCPVAEKYSKEILNFPTYPTLSKDQIEELKKLIGTYSQSQS